MDSESTSSADPPSVDSTQPGESSEAPAVEGERELLERPDFVRGFPRDPALAVLVEAFERGNYAYVRREAPRLAKRAESRAVREAAKELRRRVDPDPLFKLLIALALLLLAFVVLWTYGHRP